MLYLCAKLIAKFSFLAVYRKVYIINEDNVPGNRAALITCNHPNGFVEPLVIGGYIPHAIYFLVRGDVFKKKIARYLLNAIHCIPIFRFRDGFASMRRNNESINEALQVLSNKNPLIIFAEGSTAQVRYVRPIQKGTIRLAFDTLQNAPESNPCIIPSCIHFSEPQFYRSEVIMEYGEPINISDYEQLYTTNKAKAIKQLLDDVNNAMQALSISVDQSVEVVDADAVLEIARSTVREKDVYPIIQKISTSPNRDAERNAGKIFGEYSDEEKAKVLNEIKSLKREVVSSGISYDQLAGNTKSKSFNFLFLIFGFIPFLIGRIMNMIPIKVAQFFSKNKVKKLEFKAVMKLCPLLVIYPFYILLLGVVFGLVNWKIGFSVLLLPFLGWFSFVYEEQCKELFSALRFDKMEQTKKQDLIELYQRCTKKLA